MSKEYITREITQKVKDHLDQPEISLIVGPRQVGITTLMRQVQSYLQEKGKEILFIDL